MDADDIGSATKRHYRLPDWKDQFPVFSEVNSTALQRTVTRFYDNLSNLKDQKENGNKVGKLKWKSPRELRRAGRSTRQHQRVCVVRCGDGEAHLGQGTLLSELWVRA